MELMRRLDGMVWRIFDHAVPRCHPYIELLKSADDLQFPTHSAEENIIVPMSTGLSDEQLEYLEALQSLPKTKRAQNLVKEPTIKHAVQNAGQRVFEAIGAARSLLDFSKSEHPEEKLFACFKALMASHYPNNDYVAGVKLWL